jgi:hypothetical protein
MAADPGSRAVAWTRRVPYDRGRAAFALDLKAEYTPDCARCGSGLYPAEFAEATGNKVLAFRCILCGTYLEPGHVPNARVTRMISGPRAPRD